MDDDPARGAVTAGTPKRVREVMTPNPIVATPGEGVIDAAKKMLESNIGGLPVVEADRLVGIVTEGDLIARDVQLEYPTYLHLLDGLVMYPPVSAHVRDTLARAASATVRDVMTARPVTVSPDATVEDAAALMVERGVGRIPVTDGGRLVGIVSKSDIVRSLIAGGPPEEDSE